MTLERKNLLARAEVASRESKYVDFKQECDTASPAVWCELIKDIVAFANSGGGIIIFGIADDGSHADIDVSHILAHDAADITNRIARYTNYQFSELEIVEIVRGGKRYPAFLISASDIPIVFTKPGTYPIEGGKQKSAFAQGTVYFRHGAKSEPGNRDDLQIWRDREVARTKKSWLSGIRKVVQAPKGYAVSVVPQLPTVGSPTVSITADPTAPKVFLSNAQELFPYRQKELIREINQALGKRGHINAHDATCINRKIDVLKTMPQFAYKSHKLSVTQYSPAYGHWILEQILERRNFLQDAREEYKRVAMKR